MIVGVVGAGTMGAGIAQLCVQSGHEVVLHDVDAAAVARGRGRIVDGLERLVATGRLDAAARDAAIARVRDATTLAEVADEADVVIEAALEQLELKQTIFRAISEAAPDALLATNTSALSVSRIADAATRPERVFGLHFFNPAPVMPLVEVVAAELTDRATLDAGIAFTRSLGKTPIACRDEPGFIVNRVNRPFTLQALRIVERGDATVGEVDAAIEAAGYPMGPFRLMDLVGIDVNLAVAQALYTAFDDAPRFRPNAIQIAAVEAGALGRKTGRGFYVYPTDGRGSGVNPDFPPRPADMRARSAASAEAIVRWTEAAIINEAYHAVTDEVAAPADIDAAMKLGAAHPRGPFERAGELGLRTVVETLRELGARYGNELVPVAPALWQMASL